MNVRCDCGAQVRVVHRAVPMSERAACGARDGERAWYADEITCVECSETPVNEETKR